MDRWRIDVAADLRRFGWLILNKFAIYYESRGHLGFDGLI